MTSDSQPILVGAAQTVQRWNGDGVPDDPLGLMTRAARTALDDAGSARLAASIDRVAVVNVLTWSYADAPGALATRLGLAPGKRIYTSIGGNTPQYLVNRCAEALAEGRCRAVLLAGAETGNALAKARKLDRRFDEWPKRAEPLAVEGDQRQGVSQTEMAYELFLPSAMYPLIETAIRARARRSPREHRNFLGKLFAGFAAVAAKNPAAWFRDAHSAERIASPTPDNRYVGYPYTKLMNSIIAVDQAAAVVMTTEAHARELGIDPSHWVYPMGGADQNDVWHVTERPDLSRSPAIRAAARRAFAQAGCRIEEITDFDLYSCFPAAVEIALDALDLSADDPRPLTVTGGLPYFGGPGNNYSLHAIATAVDRVRANRDAKIFVSALGWYCTKHAIGVYGGSRGAKPWTPETDRAREVEQAAIDRTALPPPLAQAEGSARIEAFVIRHGRDGSATDATVLARLGNGARALGRVDAPGTELEALENEELVGRSGTLRHDPKAGLNLFRL
jgi:acetyl-CoA C-acetyltransferase